MGTGGNIQQVRTSNDLVIDLPPTLVECFLQRIQDLADEGGLFLVGLQRAQHVLQNEEAETWPSAEFDDPIDDAPEGLDAIIRVDAQNEKTPPSIFSGIARFG